MWVVIAILGFIAWMMLNELDDKLTGLQHDVDRILKKLREKDKDGE